MLPKNCIYFYSNCCSTSIVVSLILSLISFRSPSIKTMGSPYDLSNFCFFLAPPCYSLLHLFKIEGVWCPSSPPLPCPKSSSSSFFDDGDLSLCCDSISSFSSYSLEACPCSTPDFSVASLFFYSSSVHAAFLDASFLFCTAELPTPLIFPASKSEGACHSAGHLAITSYTYVSITIYGKSCHFCCGSFHAWMYTLWKLSLNAA